MDRTWAGRVLVVVAVVLGVLGMHALVTTPAGHDRAVAVAQASHPMPTADDGVPAVTHTDPGRHDGHGAGEHLLHLCLSVLVAVGALLLAAGLLLGRVPVVPVAPAGAATRPWPARRPPPVPRRLAVLCVLRN